MYQQSVGAEHQDIPRESAGLDQQGDLSGQQTKPRPHKTSELDSVGAFTGHQDVSDEGLTTPSSPNLQPHQHQSLPKTVTIRLSSNSTSDSMENSKSILQKDIQLPKQLLVTPHGLVNQNGSSASSSISPVRVEPTNPIPGLGTFPDIGDGDKALMKIASGDSKRANCKKVDDSGTSSQDDQSVNDIDSDINTIVITNDETGEIKMTFSDNAVGQYEEIGEKSEQKDSNVDAGGYGGVGVCHFTALQEKDGKANGVSPTRKSDRPIKLNSAFGNEDGKKIPGFGKAQPINTAKGPSGEAPSQTKAGGKRKSKKESKDDRKKTKLHVDDVYESDEGVESDGDLSKDLLKVRMLKCDSCGKHFLDKQKLLTHKKIHIKNKLAAPSSGGKKVHPCDVCGYIFGRREHWRRHRLTHLDTMPYKCPTCDRGFKRAEHVRRHQTVHTHVKAHDCPSCDKKFTRSEHLKKHMLIHLGKTPFSKSKQKVASSSEAGSD